MRRVLAFLLLFIPCAFAQTSTTTQTQSVSGLTVVVSTPSGACVNGSAAQLVASTGIIYTCQSSIWTVASSSGGGSGTVTPSAQYEVAIFPTVGTVATVQGSSVVTTDAGGDLNALSFIGNGTGAGAWVAKPGDGTCPAATSLFSIICNNSGTGVAQLSDNNGSFLDLINAASDATTTHALFPTAAHAWAFRAIAAGDIPTLNQNTSGSAASLSVSGQTGLMTVAGLTSTNRIKTVRDAADTLLELGGSYSPTGTWTNLTLVTPTLGTPASGVGTNLTGVPISTGISGLGTGVATFLATPSSANFFAAITDETGSGPVVGATAPSFTGTMNIGAASGTTGLQTFFGATSGSPTWGCNAAACTNMTSSVPVQATKYVTSSNCSSSASPAVCAAASAGTVALPTGTNPTLQVNTTAVTANSIILMTVDESLGTKLSVTCNTTLSTLLNPVVTARSAATSFTFTIGAVIASNPACVSYQIIN